MKSFFAERRPHDGLTYDEYREAWRRKLDRSLDGLDKEERKKAHYVRYNYERSQHVHERYDPSEALRDAVAAIDESQLWMVLTDDWCGDAAYNLPVIVEAARLNDSVRLRILRRDDNLDIMDQYLTGGSRSIPKLVAFAEDGTERFTWGPRPEEAGSRFREAKEAETDKEAVIEKLLAWYEKGGWQQVDDELAAAIEQGRSVKEGAAA
jgi:hypothetical protein